MSATRLTDYVVNDGLMPFKYDRELSKELAELLQECTAKRTVVFDNVVKRLSSDAEASYRELSVKGRRRYWRIGARVITMRPCRLIDKRPPIKNPLLISDEEGILASFQVHLVGIGPLQPAFPPVRPLGQVTWKTVKMTEAERRNVDFDVSTVTNYLLLR